MAIDEFDKLIREALEQRSISTEENLLGFQIDIEYGLLQAGLFQNIVVKKTGIDTCALLSTCELQKADISDKEIVKVLSKIWLAKLRYPCWEAHLFEKGDQQISMRFATANENSLFVTGQIIANRFS